MKISAVIPTFNRRMNVLRAIESVLAQTVPVHEIVVVDDGSTDGTMDAIQSRFGSKATVIRQENAGGAAALNRGVREAKSEWVAFLDSDDIWLPTKIERQVEALNALSGTHAACFTDCLLDSGADGQVSVFGQVRLCGKGKFGALENGLRYLSDTIGFATWIQSLLVERSLLFRIGGLDQTLRCEYDMDLALRLLLNTNVCVVFEPLVVVDRSPAEPRLTNRYFTRNDSRYAETSSRYRKWLDMNEITDINFRRDIENNLRVKTYDWAIAKIYDAQLITALRKIKEVRRLGDNYFTIAATLASRAKDRISRSLSATSS